jgi:hypothetical protein
MSDRCIEVYIECKWCYNTVCCAPADLDNTLRRLVKGGWLYYSTDDREERIYCPKCAERHVIYRRLEAHSRRIPGVDWNYRALDTGDICKIWFAYVLGDKIWQCDLLRCSYDRGGYKKVTVKQEGKSKQLPVHRLVCSAWHGVPDDKKNVVDHINGCRSDNRPENLRWVTQSENHGNTRYPGKQGRPLVGFNEDGETVEFPAVSFITRDFPKALAVADKTEFDDHGWIFVDADYWNAGCSIGVEFEQMKEAKMRSRALRKRYYEWLGVTA